MNVRKSKVMKCTRGGNGRRMNVILNGEVMEEVDCFGYLGSCVSGNGGVVEEVSSRLGKAGMAWGAMKTVFKNRGVSMEVKRRLYESVIVPSALYGSETWGMKVVERRRMNVFDMRCLRYMAGVTVMDRVRNEEIRRRVGVEKDLADRVDERVLGWFGHVERMENERLAKQIVGSEVSGPRARGRPRLGWMDGVKRALDARGMSVADARLNATDRAAWRVIVRN